MKKSVNFLLYASTPAQRERLELFHIPGIALIALGIVLTTWKPRAVIS